MGLPEKAWSEDAATLAGKKFKIEQVALTARLTREDKVMCFRVLIP